MYVVCVCVYLSVCIWVFGLYLLNSISPILPNIFKTSIFHRKKTFWLIFFVCIECVKSNETSITMLRLRKHNLYINLYELIIYSTYTGEVIVCYCFVVVFNVNRSLQSRSIYDGRKSGILWHSGCNRHYNAINLRSYLLWEPRSAYSHSYASSARNRLKGSNYIVLVVKRSRYLHMRWTYP